MDRNLECEICTVLYYCMNYRGEAMRFVGWILMCTYVQHMDRKGCKQTNERGREGGRVDE